MSVVMSPAISLPREAKAKPQDLKLIMPHVRQLDGIRAIAVSLVFVAHSGLDRIIPGGFGVSIFFFLSGYLITSLLRSEASIHGTVDLKNFYLRRTLRIIPPLYITLLVVAILCASGIVKATVNWNAVPSQFLFFQNYASHFGLSDPLPYMGLWSLAVEEHFYLVFPLCFAVLLRKVTPRNAALFCFAFCLLVLAGRIYNVFHLADFRLNYFWTHTRVDSILFGSCLAFWNNPVLDGERSYRPKAWHVSLAVGVLLMCFVIRNESFRESLRYTLQGAAFFVLFSWALHAGGITKRMLSSKPAQLLGNYSYSIYLIHFVILRACEQHFDTMPSVIRILLALALTLFYAVTMYYVVERPCAQLRRLLQNRSLGLAVATSGEQTLAGPTWLQRRLATSRLGRD